MHSNTGHFRRELLPPAQLFYERELGRLHPAGRNRAIGNCPFHKSKSGRSFSVDLVNGLWYCHGCGFGGDVIKFVMRRDGCSFKAACQVLGCWRGNATAEERTAIVRRQQERQWNREREAEQAEAERKQRIDLRDELHLDVRLYQEVDAELHKLGTQAEEHWSALPPLLDDWRLTESDYCRAAELENLYR